MSAIYQRPSDCYCDDQYESKCIMMVVKGEWRCFQHSVGGNGACTTPGCQAVTRGWYFKGVFVCFACVSGIVD